MRLISTLTPKPPYSFPLTLDILTRYTHPTLDRVRDGAYWRALHVDDALALISIQADDEGKLAVYLVDSIGEVNNEALIVKLKHMLAIEDDLSPFYEFARQDDTLWNIVHPLMGVRLIRTASVFEALAITTTEQQISWVAAQKAQLYLLEWGNHHIANHDEIFYAFPTPQQFANATLDDLKPTKITFKRMQVIIDIAKQMVDGTLNLESIRDMPIEDAYKALVALKGIGHWTATWTLSRTHGHHNYVGHNDVALQAAVNYYFYGGEGKIPEAQVTETFDRFGEYGGLAAHYTLMRLVLDRYEKRE